MQHLEVSCAVRRFFKSLGFMGLKMLYVFKTFVSHFPDAPRTYLCKYT